MLKQLAVLLLVCSMRVNTLKENALEHKDLQTVAEKLRGTFQTPDRHFLLVTVAGKEWEAIPCCSPVPLVFRDFQGTARHLHCCLFPLLSHHTS